MSVSSRIDNWKCRWKNFWQTNFYVAHFQRRTQSLSKIVTNHHSSTMFEIQPKKCHFYFKNQFESSRQKSIIQAQFLSFLGGKIQIFLKSKWDISKSFQTVCRSKLKTFKKVNHMGYQLLLNTNQEIKMRWDDYQKMGLFCYICLVDLVLQKLLFHSRKKLKSKQIYLYWREVWEQQKSINSSHASLQSQKGVLRTQVCNQTSIIVFVLLNSHL